MIEYSRLVTANSAIASGHLLEAHAIAPGAIERHIIVCGGTDPGPDDYYDPDDIPMTAVFRGTDDCSARTCRASRASSA